MLFEKYVICSEGFGDVHNEDGRVVGFQVKIRLPYYRGVRLSMIDNLTVKVEGKEYSRDQLRFTISEGTFTLDEMTTMTDTYWDFGEKATITVLEENGFSRQYGANLKNVSIGIFLRIAYASFYVTLDKALACESGLMAIVS